jgi:hypothetical protein
VPQGTIKEIYCDGSNNLYRADRADVGEVKHFATASVPAGYLECDGTAIKRAKAPDLYAAIALTWGPGNGSDDFPLPDLKTAGRFLRSRSGSVALGTIQADTVGVHNHPGSGSVSGSVSLSIAADGAWTPSISISDPSHAHSVGGTGQMLVGAGGPYALPAGSQMGSQAGTNAATTGISASSSAAPAHAHAGSTASFSGSISVTVSNNTGTTETRPLNVSMLACIRY